MDEFYNQFNSLPSGTYPLNEFMDRKLNPEELYRLGLLDFFQENHPDYNPVVPNIPNMYYDYEGILNIPNFYETYKPYEGMLKTSGTGLLY